jgi:hypothetical protein
MRVGAIRSIVLSAVREEGGATEVDAVVRMINWNVGFYIYSIAIRDLLAAAKPSLRLGLGTSL